MLILKPYKYFLISASQGTLELISAPQNWENRQFQWNRSSKYKGVTRKVSIDSVVFLNESRAFLDRGFEAEGTEGTCEYVVQRMNWNNYTYEEIFRGEIDYSTRKLTETLCQ